MELRNTSWQERYRATQVYTLRCKILDEPGMLAKVAQAIGDAKVHIGSIAVVGVDGTFKIRDINIFCPSLTLLEFRWA